VNLPNYCFLVVVDSRGMMLVTSTLTWVQRLLPPDLPLRRIVRPTRKRKRRVSLVGSLARRARRPRMTNRRRNERVLEPKGCGRRSLARARPKSRYIPPTHAHMHPTRLFGPGEDHVVLYYSSMSLHTPPHELSVVSSISLHFCVA
jgi:hypothetical protein